MDQRSGDGRFSGRLKKSSHSMQNHIHFLNLKMFDTRIASVLNKIGHKFLRQEKVSLEEQKTHREDRFLRGIANVIHDYFRYTGAYDTVLDHADLLTITLPNDDVQELETRWDEIPLKIKISPNDVLESLYN